MNSILQYCDIIVGCYQSNMNYSAGLLLLNASASGGSTTKTQIRLKSATGHLVSPCFAA